MLHTALTEYNKGFERITAESADNYFKHMQNVGKHINKWQICLLPIDILCIILHYNKNHKTYIAFRRKVIHSDFWKGFLVK